MALASSQTERTDELADVARSAAIVLSFLDPPKVVPAMTLKAFSFIVVAVGLLALLVFALFA
jgi:hypothetical protein